MQNWGSCEHWLVWPSLEPLMQNWQAAAVKNESWIAWQTCSKQCRSHETCCAIFVQHMFPKYSNNANSDFPKFVQCWFLISYDTLPPPSPPPNLSQNEPKLIQDWQQTDLTPNLHPIGSKLYFHKIDHRLTRDRHQTDTTQIPSLSQLAPKISMGVHWYFFEMQFLSIDILV